jgi:CPA1 family monovalent cation:H+ antiporter
MLRDNLLLIVSLLFIISMLAMLSNKLRISYPIFLVLAGLGISMIPGIPRLELDPDMVFVIFLPPLLYSAAWNTSWHDFWKYKRSIGLLAFGLVLCTALAVAWFSHLLMPDFTLALGFVLGGIISPPDAVAASSVLQNLKVPKRVVDILEGESLVNDASSLIVFRFAMAAILTGKFVFWQAGTQFLLVVTMGILIGLAIAYIAFAIQRWLPTTSSIDTAISLVCPYLMYLAAEHFHFSGVLAVVSGGLFLSYRSPDILSYESRLQAQSVWNIIVFLLNGVVFILIGLQLPAIVHGLGEYSLAAAIGYGALISLVAIIVRILWVFPGAYCPRMISKTIRKREKRPSTGSIFVISWAGMRGVVSLASAFAIPIALPSGAAFPHRDMILFITFCVILFTLVFQGLTLPLIIRWLKIESHENKEEERLGIRLRMANAIVGYINTHYNEQAGSIEAFTRLKSRYERMAAIASSRLTHDGAADSQNSAFLPEYRKLLIELVDVQRQELAHMRRTTEYSEEALRAKETELDLEEARYRR